VITAGAQGAAVRDRVRHARPRIRRKGPIVLRLLLVEDHTLFRGTLALVLRLRPDMEVVAECGSVAECRALGDLLGSVDVAVLDLLLPDGEGTELVAVLREANPDAKALILSTSIETELVGRLSGVGGRTACSTR
jgi:DNA-binding NarL/FixJ family response regulator